MRNTYRMIILAALGCAIGAVLVMKNRERETPPETVAPVAVVAPTNALADSGAPVPDKEALPRLVDLGADQCVPCKMMAPILEELKQEFADTFEVEFIDVWKNPDAGEQYGIRVIPTQIFYDAAGKELFRHEGFFGREDILAKWREHGVAVPTDVGSQSVQ